LNIEGVKRMRT